MTEITQGVRSILSRPMIYELWSSLVGGARARAILIADHVRPSAGERILDLGCGPGELLSAMPDEVAYFGVDISDAYIARAREQFGDRAEFVTGDASRFDPAGRQFDLALAVGVLHHLDDDQARGLFSTAAKALTAEGRVVTIDPTFSQDQSRLAREVISRDRGQHVRVPKDYAQLPHGVFGKVNTVVRDDLLRIPYTHCILECAAPAVR